MSNSDQDEKENPEPQGYAFLFIEARKAADDISEIRDAEGGSVQIERHPSYPGAKLLVFETPAAPIKHKIQWILPATSQRPDFYPAGLPHLPDIASTVMEGEGRTVVVWKDEGCPRVAPEEAERLKSSMPEEFKTFLAAMKEVASQGKGVTPEAAAAIEEYRTRLSQEDVKAWMASMSKPEEVDERFIDGFEALVKESKAAGWLPAEDDEDQPMVFRSATFQMDGVRRRVMLTATLGNGFLHLNEEVPPPTPPREGS